MWHSFSLSFGCGTHAWTVEGNYEPILQSWKHLNRHKQFAFLWRQFLIKILNREGNWKVFHFFIRLWHSCSLSFGCGTHAWTVEGYYEPIFISWNHLNLHKQFAFLELKLIIKILNREGNWKVFHFFIKGCGIVAVSLLGVVRMPEL